LLDRDRLADDALDRVGVRSAFEVREEEAGKVGVETLVARDELVLRASVPSRSDIVIVARRGREGGREGVPRR
jgi:hypothetical protein